MFNNKTPRHATVDLEYLYAGVSGYAPTAEVRRAISQIRREMELAGEPEEAVAAALAGLLVDGLRHGNWPE
jgi:hypothetical protein